MGIRNYVGWPLYRLGSLFIPPPHTHTPTPPPTHTHTHLHPLDTHTHTPQTRNKHRHVCTWKHSYVNKYIYTCQKYVCYIQWLCKLVPFSRTYRVILTVWHRLHQRQTGRYRYFGGAGPVELSQRDLWKIRPLLRFLGIVKRQFRSNGPRFRQKRMYRQTACRPNVWQYCDQLGIILVIKIGSKSN